MRIVQYLLYSTEGESMVSLHGCWDLYWAPKGRGLLLHGAGITNILSFGAITCSLLCSEMPGGRRC